ncbi:MAG: DNA repair protein RecO [Desulfobacteraceae bacterium]|nr:DNA repair protein RecO [Desulfobacteraceae bacterium]
MSGFSTPAILLRRIDYGDYDLIVTFLSLAKGKISALAKNAKKSRKRFSGLLEPFTALELVCRSGRAGGMPILQEASMHSPFAGIREDVFKTLYAAYWAELINGWMEEWKSQPRVYRLLYDALNALDLDLAGPEEISIIFQMRFLSLAGYTPKLDLCGACGTALDLMAAGTVIFDLEKGGIVCNGCAAGESRTRLRISKGAVKQLCWIRENDFKTLQRLRFTPTALREALSAMEAFVPYHLGRMPRSLRVLGQMRRR